MTQNEIDFFDRLSAQWDASETLSTPETIGSFLDMLALRLGAAVLDLGTGTGVLVPFIHRAIGPGGTITAVDFSQGMLNRAIAKFGELPGVTFLRSDFENEPIAGKFDYIFMYCVYPHLHHPVATLKRLIDENLTDEGSLIIAFPTDHEFVNNIHRERKAESDLLPSASRLAEKLRNGGLNATAVSDANPYVVVVTKESVSRI